MAACKYGLRAPARNEVSRLEAHIRVSVFQPAPEPARPCVLSLPFVRETTLRERRAGYPPRLFWSVTPSGCYSLDTATGARFAEAARDFIARGGCPDLLQHVVSDMMQDRPELSGVEVGFLSTFGRFVVSTKTRKAA